MMAEYLQGYGETSNETRPNTGHVGAGESSHVDLGRVDT